MEGAQLQRSKDNKEEGENRRSPLHKLGHSDLSPCRKFTVSGSVLTLILRKSFTLSVSFFKGILHPKCTL